MDIESENLPHSQPPKTLIAPATNENIDARSTAVAAVTPYSSVKNVGRYTVRPR